MPSSLISTLAPLSSTISLITFPPEPITSLILSTGTCIVSILGAVELTVSLGVTGEIHYVDLGYNTIGMPKPE